MRSPLLLSAIASVLVGSWTVSGLAQQPAGDTALVRRQLEKRYDENRRAFFAKDLDAIMALRTEDFHTLTPDGLTRDLARAIVRQHVDRFALRADGQVHHVETWVTQRETWRKTPDGWKLYRVDSLRDQRRLVDGKRGS